MPSLNAAAPTVAAYLRVSTDEQVDSGGGLAAQRATIEAEVRRRRWTIKSWHVDEGISGAKGDAARPGLAAALETVTSRRAEHLVVAKLDRLSRNLHDLTGYMERATAERWSLVSCDLLVDMSTPAGEMFAHMTAAFSHYERRLIGARTRDALAAKRAQGVRLGRPPVISAAIAVRIRDERAQGRTLRSIAAGLTADAVPTARGGAAWSTSTVQSVLNRKGATS